LVIDSYLQLYLLVEYKVFST